MSEHRTFIRRAGIKFPVTVEPEIGGANLDQEFDTHRAAFGHAVGIRMTRGFPIVDLSAEHSPEIANMIAGGRRDG